MITISNETIEILRHILDARIDNADNNGALSAWYSAKDIIEYALADNIECLRQFDYLDTKEDIEAREDAKIAERESLGMNWW